VLVVVPELLVELLLELLLDDEELLEVVLVTGSSTSVVPPQLIAAMASAKTRGWLLVESMPRALHAVERSRKAEPLPRPSVVQIGFESARDEVASQMPSGLIVPTHEPSNLRSTGGIGRFLGDADGAIEPVSGLGLTRR